MSAILLDSNMIIYSVRPEHRLLHAFLRQHRFYASEVSIVEALGYPKIELDEFDELERFFRHCPLLSVDRPTIDQAARLRRHRKMSLGDALIAATALVHDLTLATRNTRDFAGVAGLRVVDPLDGAGPTENDAS